MKKEYTYIDLFSGPGGLCTGFISEGFVPRIAVEWSDTTIETYAKSHNAEIYELKDENIYVITRNHGGRYIGGDIYVAIDKNTGETLKVWFGE